MCQTVSDKIRDVVYVYLYSVGNIIPVRKNLNKTVTNRITEV